MSLHFKSFEEMLELMSDKVVKTEQGPYIRVSDLKTLNDELGKARQAQREQDAVPKPKSFAGANEAARKDKEFSKLFETQDTKAPAVVRDTNVANKEKSDESAAA